MDDCALKLLDTIEHGYSGEIVDSSSEDKLIEMLHGHLSSLIDDADFPSAPFVVPRDLPNLAVQANVRSQ